MNIKNKHCFLKMNVTPNYLNKKDWNSEEPTKRLLPLTKPYLTSKKIKLQTLYKMSREKLIKMSKSREKIKMKPMNSKSSPIWLCNNYQKNYNLVQKFKEKKDKKKPWRTNLISWPLNKKKISYKKFIKKKMFIKIILWKNRKKKMLLKKFYKWKKWSTESLRTLELRTMKN